MGEPLLQIYRTRVKREHKLAFLGGIVATLLVHLFKFVNYLPNHDSLYNYYASQNMTVSGRWALSAACGLSSFFDLPWVIGALSALFIGLTAALVVAIFKIKNPFLIVLASALLASAPGITETFFFLYTADGYMIAMFAATLGAYFMRLGEKRVSRFFLGSVCICISCGIYQAYVSFALVLIVLSLALELLRDTVNIRYAVRHTLCTALAVAASMVTYLIIWKVILAVSGTQPTSYQGISDVGVIGVSGLLSALAEAVRTVLFYLLQWNVLEHGFSVYSVLSLAFLATFVASFILATVKSRIYKRPAALALLMAAIVSVLPFSCIWLFFSNGVSYRPMMLVSLTLPFIFVGVLFEEFAGSVAKNLVCLLLCAISLNNALMANIAYYYMDRCYERTYAEGVLMMSRIYELADEHEFDRIAVIGNLCYEVQYENSDPDSWHGTPAGQVHILTSGLEMSLLFDSDHTVSFLKNTFGLELSAVDENDEQLIAESETGVSMPCWPAAGSVAVNDGVLIIKLSEFE